MKFFKHVEQLHKLIEEENTGSPKELAGKMRMSVSNMHNVIKFLKDKGARIKYNHKKNSYYYVTPFVVNIFIEMRPLSEDEMRSVIGGCFLPNSFLLPGGKKDVLDNPFGNLFY